MGILIFEIMVKTPAICFPVAKHSLLCNVSFALCKVRLLQVGVCRVYRHLLLKGIKGTIMRGKAVETEFYVQDIETKFEVPNLRQT